MDQRKRGSLSSESETESILANVELNETGLSFVTRCLTAIEKLGLQVEGLYRTCGAQPEVTSFINTELVDRNSTKLTFDDNATLEIKVLTSAVKTYLRLLREPLLTFRLHHALLKAAQSDESKDRVGGIQRLLEQLPKANKEMLELLACHLKTVSESSDKTRMTTSNLAICFGPTLMRSAEKEKITIKDMDKDIRLCNVVVETIIEHCTDIFSHADSSAKEQAESLSLTSSDNVTSSDNMTSLDNMTSSDNVTSLATLLQPASSASDSGLSSISANSSNTEEKTPKADIDDQSMNSNTGSPSRPLPDIVIKREGSEGATPTNRVRTQARTLFDCEAEDEHELSFKRGQLLRHVWSSPEPGWLIASLGDKRGIVPANFVELL